jgi:hypothetical protein
MKLLIVLLTTLACISCQVHTKEVFYFNSDLDFFVVVYDLECGTELEKSTSGDWEYFIPDNGVLILKNKREKGGIINMEAYEKVNGEYQLHCRVSPFAKDFGEPRGGVNHHSYTYNKENICGNSQRFGVDLYVYVINYREDTEERINDFVKSVLFDK